MGEATEVIHSSNQSDKTLKSFAEKWAAMVIDHIKKCDATEIRVLYAELKERQNPYH